ncbi:LPXTG cell wall anchor domain-containing protein [Telmatocola sphagniphila]|uniref:LPXTG cell wall anchor domain-containing protein n=1 Tax=Telmatocola sphagniphila TaxID=1123043 RepID=A0A8E6B3X4_9BACT|nr:LPXTG cell wall anchor domain-containing protein [Telmatocola sphagniphila]QVL30666.1 LPXTG cell wall anchor domain-containing protein [Telmatocola sphagniphila]
MKYNWPFRDCGTVVAICILLVLCPNICHALSDDEQITRSAIIGYSSNIESFSFYTVKFQFTSAKSSTHEDAIQGKWEGAKSYIGVHTVDGEFESYEHDGKPPPKISAPSNGKAKGGVFFQQINDFMEEKYIRSPSGTAKYTRGIDAINLRRLDTDDPFDFATPLSMGFLGHRFTRGPDKLLQDKSNFEPSFLGRMERNGKHLIGVRFTEPRYGQIHDFFFDPTQGFLVAYYELRVDNKLNCRALLLEAKEVAPNRWFPMRTMMIYEPSLAGSGKCLVYEIKTLTLDVDRRPKPEDISCSFPAGTQVFVVGEKGLFYLKQNETVTAYGLAELFDKVDKSTKLSVMDTALIAQRPNFKRQIWFSLFGALLVLIGGVWLWLRKKQNTNA